MKIKLEIVLKRIKKKKKDAWKTEYKNQNLIAKNSEILFIYLKRYFYLINKTIVIIHLLISIDKESIIHFKLFNYYIW